jgi:hypothetical protein
MNNNNNNNSSAFPPSKGRKREISEEAAILNTFALIVRNKFTATPSSPTHEVDGTGAKNDNDNDTGRERMKNLDSLYMSPSYSAEKKMITKISNDGMAKGLAVGLLTFSFLRIGPRVMNRYLNRSYSRSSSSTGGNSTSGGGPGGYQFDIRNTNNMTKLNQNFNSNSNQQQQNIPRPGIFIRSIKFCLDITVSLSLAMYGSAYFMDTKKFFENVSNIPLVEGRSMISDELCDDFIDVYRAIPKKTWDKYSRDNGNGNSDSDAGDKRASDGLKLISSFVKNCLRRQIVEQEILNQQQAFGTAFNSTGDDHDGIDNDNDRDMHHNRANRQHVEIPPPGVNKDIEVEIPWIDKSEDLKVGREVDDFFYDDSDDFDWDDGHNDNDNDQSNDNDKNWK